MIKLTQLTNKETSIPEIALRIGNYLNFQSYQRGDHTHIYSYRARTENGCEAFYLNNKTLVAISIVGIMIVGMGALALCASMGSLPSLMTFLQAGNFSPLILKIIGASLIGLGALTTTVHSSMLGLKLYAEAKTIVTTHPSDIV